MTRTYSADANETVQAHLELLLQSVGNPVAYQAAMTALGRDLGAALAGRLSPEKPVVVVCTVEDADFLASGMLEQLGQAGHREVLLACFWNERYNIGDHKVAEIKRRYIEPLPEEAAVVVLKSIISGACVVRTNLLEILGQVKASPEEVFVVAPVMHTGAPERLAQELPEGMARRFKYVYFALDADRDESGIIHPGVGGSVYENLGWTGQDEKNRYFPRLVNQRNARFL